MDITGDPIESFQGLKISAIPILENENEQHYYSSSISTDVSSCFTVL